MLREYRKKKNFFFVIRGKVTVNFVGRKSSSSNITKLSECWN